MEQVIERIEEDILRNKKRLRTLRLSAEFASHAPKIRYSAKISAITTIIQELQLLKDDVIEIMNESL